MPIELDDFPWCPLGCRSSVVECADEAAPRRHGNTVLLNNGATVTGNVIDNGTLQFNQSGTTLTISNVISGTGTLNVSGGRV